MFSLLSLALHCAFFVSCHSRENVFEMDIQDAVNEAFQTKEKISKIKQQTNNGKNFSFASYYGDQMVLQSSPQKSVIWGYAATGHNGKMVEIEIIPGRQLYSTIVKEDLTWAAEIGPILAGGPYTIKAFFGEAVIELSDVLFGDVWFCSGESNMNFPLKDIFNGSDEVKDTLNYPDIRMFVSGPAISPTPLADLMQDSILLPWSKPSLETSKEGNFSAVCWLYGKYLYQHLKKPIGLVQTSVDGLWIEAWSSPDVLSKCGISKSDRVTVPNKKSFVLQTLRDDDNFNLGISDHSILWNAMVHPFIHMTIYGVIWYQGEADSELSYYRKLYNCTFPAMIDDWRKKFSSSGGSSQLFPFGFVQLCGNHPNYNISTGFPDIRWHQTADYGYVPNHRQRNVFMAVAMDLPDFTSPYGSEHSRNKQDVAKRLAVAGLALAYKQNVSYQGPYPVSVSITHAELPYTYTQVEIEYSMDLQQQWLDGFEICCAFVKPAVCEPGKAWWLPAATWQAYDRNNVTQSYVSQCSMDDVVGIRYAWRESPCPFKKCAIYGAKNGLPMPPFTYHGKAFTKTHVGNNKYAVKLGRSALHQTWTDFDSPLTPDHVDQTLIYMEQLPISVEQTAIHVEQTKDQINYAVENMKRTFSFASYYGDHMVLQGSPKKAVLWGYAPPTYEGETVEVFVSETHDRYSTTVTEDLLWAVQIGPFEAGGPYTIGAVLGTHLIELEDVLFGDVWVCSGQSNMQFSMSQVFNSSAELNDTVNYPDLRVFVVKDNTSTVPMSDFTSDGILLPWSIPSPETIGGGTFKYFSAVCWLYGKYLYQHLQKPIGLLETSWGGTPVEGWSSPDALKKCGLENDVETNVEVGGPEASTVLWNAMVHPLLNMTIYGAIWYQGENNAKKNMDLYNCTFPAMIDDWRKKFSYAGGTDKLFPFGFVQLAPNTPNYDIDVGFPDIRWHQTADYGYAPNHRQRNVFMAVAMDLPDFTSPYGSIHPRDKQDVAWRLVLGGLAVAYKQDVSYQGPYPVKLSITQSGDTNNYTQVDVEYTMNIQQRWLDGFEVCCAFTSPAECEEGKAWWLPTVTIQKVDAGNASRSYASECEIENLVGLRYAWKESPCQFKNCAIYGDENGLPMPPFSYSGKAFNRQYIDGRYEIIL